VKPAPASARMVSLCLGLNNRSSRCPTTPSPWCNRSSPSARCSAPAPTSLYRSTSGSQQRSPRGGDQMDSQVRNLLPLRTNGVPSPPRTEDAPPPSPPHAEGGPLPLEHARWRRPSLFVRPCLHLNRGVSRRKTPCLVVFHPGHPFLNLWRRWDLEGCA
jgi:hypothetical protein